MYYNKFGKKLEYNYMYKHKPAHMDGHKKIEPLYTYHQLEKLASERLRKVTLENIQRVDPRLYNWIMTSESDFALNVKNNFKENEPLPTFVHEKLKKTFNEERSSSFFAPQPPAPKPEVEIEDLFSYEELAWIRANTTDPFVLSIHDTIAAGRTLSQSQIDSVKNKMHKDNENYEEKKVHIRLRAITTPKVIDKVLIRNLITGGKDQYRFKYETIFEEIDATGGKTGRLFLYQGYSPQVKEGIYSVRISSGTMNHDGQKMRRIKELRFLR